MNDIKYEILETLIEFPSDERGWRMELNLISWNEKPPRYDLRAWNEDHSRMGKGITFKKEDLTILKEKLGGIEL